MKKVKLYAITPIVEECRSRLEPYCDMTIEELPMDVGQEEILRRCAGAEIVVVGEQTLEQRTYLELQRRGMKLLACARGTPVNIEDWGALKRAGIPLIHAPGRSRHSVAEFTIGLMIALTRHLALLSSYSPKGREYMGEAVEDIYTFRENVESDVPKGYVHPAFTYGATAFELYGRTLGLLGFGPIGAEVCRLAKAFEMRVLTYDPYITAERAARFGAEKVERDVLLSESHIISNHMAVTPETRGMIDRTWYAKMRRGVYLINTGRAAVFDQQDMVEALQDGTVAGAACDVSWKEPVPANHPFWSMEQVLMTPHIAGVTMDMRTWQSRLITEDILRYCRQEPLENLWKRTE